MIEVIVTIAIAAVLIALAAPSAINWIVVQRVKASAAEVVGDIRFAKGEAIKRNQRVAIEFTNINGQQSCYTVHTASIAAWSCPCTQGEGFACDLDNNPVVPNFNTRLVELKTVSMPANTNVVITANRIEAFLAPNGFPDPTLLARGGFAVSVDGGSNRTLRVISNAAGRAQVCAPSDSKIAGYPSCPP